MVSKKAVALKKAAVFSLKKIYIFELNLFQK